MAARERRQRKHVERLGNYADDEALGELELESESEGEGSDAEEARGAVAKAARRAGGGRAVTQQTAVTDDMLSTLLAGAPALVDCLLLEDSMRSITLCCRNVVNLNIAAGGSVNLEPVWQALASRVKAKAAVDAAAAAEQATAAADGLAAPEAGAVPAPAAAAAAAPAAPEPAPEPEPAGRRTRRGRAKKPKPPPEPSALDVVKAAVAADPTRSTDVRKTTAPWVYKIAQKNLAALPTHKGQYGKTLYCYELDVRTLAWRRWGDQARMEAAKHRAEEQEQQRREQCERRLQEEKEARREEVAIRLAENGLPPDTAEVPANYRLADWIRWGSHWGGGLDDIMATIIERHQAQLEAAERERLRQERTQLLNDNLEAESLQFFKRDWRYRGEADGLEALLGTARRRQAARQAEGERHRELGDRLDAAGLEFWHSTSPMFAEWLKKGKGDIHAIVQQRRLRVDRECQLQYLLEMNGLLHRQNSERCKKYITGELLHGSGEPYTAKEVVSSLLASLGTEHTRCLELLDRLREERLPPVMHLSWCQTYVTAGGDLDAVIYQVKEYVDSRADVGVPPPGRPWAAAGNSTDARIGAHAWVPLVSSNPAAVKEEQDEHELLDLRKLRASRGAVGCAAVKQAAVVEEENPYGDAAEMDGDADGSSQGGDSTGVAAGGGSGSVQEPGPAVPAIAAAAAAEGEADAGPAAGLADDDAVSSPVPLGAAEPEPQADEEEQGAAKAAAIAAPAAGQEPATAAEAASEGTVDDMAVEQAAEQAAAGGETPFFSAEEAVAATAAKAGQQH